MKVAIVGYGWVGKAMHKLFPAAVVYDVLGPDNDRGAVNRADIAFVTDAASGAVRPSLFGPYARARWAIVDGGGGDTSHTFSVSLYAV
jgi:hypothetical protein